MLYSESLLLNSALNEEKDVAVFLFIFLMSVAGNPGNGCSPYPIYSAGCKLFCLRI